jgi:RNA 2',3'-cyclic 3'-phosphodiesterase
MRTFISIELPERIRKEIFKEFEKIKNSGLVSGNFVKKENLHLTLKFLGNISEDEINKIKDKLSEISFSKFELFTDGVGFFPSEKYIKILWTKLVSNQLKFIKDIIEEKLFEIGVNKEVREFSSHVTVARIKNIKDKTKFLEKVKELQIKKMGFKVDKISLIKSELTRSGPIYKILKEFDLTD